MAELEPKNTQYPVRGGKNLILILILENLYIHSD